MGKMITALDVGSHEIRAVMIKILDKETPQVIGVARTLSRGIKKGVVIDIHEASEVIVKILKELEMISGIKPTPVITTINGVNLQSLLSKGIIAVSRADREISDSDVARSLKAAQSASLGPNREILDVIARDFTIDNEEGIKNPVGMNGVRLEANAVIMSASAASMRNLSRAIELSGSHVEQFIAGPLASAQGVISPRQKDLGVLVCDIGSDTTGIIIYEEGEVSYFEILPVGASLITSDIAIGLRIDIDTAETIKVKYGRTLSGEIRKTEMIELHSLGFGEDLRVRRQEVAEIIHARTVEILALVSKTLEKTGAKNFLPAGVVLVGGGAKLEGLISLAKDQLRLPVRIGYPENFQGLVEQIADPTFARVAGLVAWEQKHNPSLSNRDSYMSKFGNSFQTFLNRILP